jgi:hypothetical protein
MPSRTHQRMGLIEEIWQEENESDVHHLLYKMRWGAGEREVSNTDSSKMVYQD